MHKFSPELDGNCLGWIFESEDAAADAIARLQHDDFAAGDREIARRCQTGGARANNQDVLDLLFICPGGSLRFKQFNPAQPNPSSPVA